MDDRAAARLLRVDARTGRVRAAVPVSGRLAIAAGPRGVWAVEAGGDYGIRLPRPLLRVDPLTGAGRARGSLGGAPALRALPRGRDGWRSGPRAGLRGAA